MGEMVSYETKAKFEDLRAENARLRAALMAIATHELRDHEDYEEIQDMATAALAIKTGC